MSVFRDGVWVDFSVVNLHSDRVYLAMLFVGAPLAKLQLWDTQRRRWHIPQFEGTVQFDNPDMFLSLEPSASAKFRVQASSNAKPLELNKDVVARDVNRPHQLSYVVNRWAHVYTSLTQVKKERLSVYVIGTGQVPVKWFDRESPADWNSHVRLRK